MAEGYGGYGKDSYGEALKFGQQETREKDHTISNIQVQLPKGNIKIDRDINAQAYQAQAYSAPAYKADYKPAY